MHCTLPSQGQPLRGLKIAPDPAAGPVASSAAAAASAAARPLSLLLRAHLSLRTVSGKGVKCTLLSSQIGPTLLF